MHASKKYEAGVVDRCMKLEGFLFGSECMCER